MTRVASCCSTQEVHQVAGGERIEVVLGLQQLRRLVDGPAAEGADLAAQLLRAADAVALPERHRARHARGGRDDDAVALDLLDAPRRRAQQEHLARPRLVDHLLVELADATAVGEHHGVQPAVRDRARVGHRELARALARADRPRDTVPDDARAQLAELLRRIAPVEHVQDVLQQLARQLGVGVGLGDQPEQVVDQDRRFIVALHPGGDRHDLLAEDVERVARDDRRLDLALAHQLDDDRALQEVGAELREDAALGGVADGVAGAADALQAARDRLGGLDLQHEVDGAHVDAQLQRRRRHQARQLPGLELLLDDQPLLARQGPVVGARDLDGRPLRLLVLLGRQLVEAQRQPLGAAPVVDEDDRRAVLADELEQLRVHRRPDRLARGLAPADRRLQRIGRRRLLGLDHRLDRHLDLEVQRLAHAGVDDPARPLRADHEAADLLQRVLRRAQPDPLRVAAAVLGGDQRAQPLQRQREVRAALGRGDRVDLVDDDRLDVAQHVARLRGQHEVQRLGRRDQHVGRRAPHRHRAPSATCRRSGSRP